MYEEAVYNVSNECFSAAFDGKGAICYYALADEKQYIKNGTIIVKINGQRISPFVNKKVTMCGRMQAIVIDLLSAKLTITQFVDKKVNGIFTSFSLNGSNAEVEVGITSSAFRSGTPVYDEDRNTILSQNYKFAANIPYEFVGENSGVYFSLNNKNDFHYFITCGDKTIDPGYYIENFEKFHSDCLNEIYSIKIPNHLNEKEKALYLNCYFCSLENYKEKGDFKAFMAGHDYLIPMRSYYRDSFFTILPMYNGKTELVRNQIMTLAKGIGEDGSCPSAVLSNFEAYWEDHYDSPSFFAIMLYDYIRVTEDLTILTELVGEKTVFDKAENAIIKLSEKSDETGLLYKEGKYNKLDWADEVNRYGYVTYDEILYARALFSIAQIYELLGNQKKSSLYLKKFENVKEKINQVLWDDTLGWYVNFKNEDYIENNLSIDTVFAAIFGIASDEQACRMLSNMEKYLESRNHPELEDYGVLCVYPPYSHMKSAYFKSLEPYRYHNGANWPYLSAMYAYAKRKYNMEYHYALESWFDFNVKKGHYTPVEYFSPYYPKGSLLQAWSGNSAFVLDEALSMEFWD